MNEDEVQAGQIPILVQRPWTEPNETRAIREGLIVDSFLPSHTPGVHHEGLVAVAAIIVVELVAGEVLIELLVEVEV